MATHDIDPTSTMVQVAAGCPCSKHRARAADAISNLRKAGYDITPPAAMPRYVQCHHCGKDVRWDAKLGRYVDPDGGTYCRRSSTGLHAPPLR